MKEERTQLNDNEVIEVVGYLRKIIIIKKEH
jgi:hypothetical protein